MLTLTENNTSGNKMHQFVINLRSMQTISNTSYPSLLKKNLQKLGGQSVYNILFSFFCHGKKVQKFNNTNL